MTETSAELRTHATTCVETDNRSAFWMPTVEEDGVRLLPGTTASGGGKHALVYYRCRHSACRSARTCSRSLRTSDRSAGTGTP